jgi:hypothetical protein
MKRSVMAGALAVAMWGGTALADEWSQQQTKTEVSTPSGSTTTVTSPSGTTTITPSDSVNAAEPSLDQRTSMPPAEGEEKNTTVIVNPPTAAAPAPAVVPEPVYVPVEKKEKSDMRGLTVMLGGGVEGYTGDFAPRISPGPSWGVTAALKPSKVLGIELGYSGAVNELRRFEAAEGADLVRNGGQAVATVGLTATPVQPYLLGGIGINKYDVRGNAPSAGFRSDVSGNIPLGGGLRTHIGNFTADARFGYNVLFDNDLVAVGGGTNIGGTDTTLGAGGRYSGMLQVGSTF